MDTVYRDLDTYSDIFEFTQEAKPVTHMLPPGRQTVETIRNVLGFVSDTRKPKDIRLEKKWEEDEISCEEISWSTGYGPRTRAWLYWPTHLPQPLPAIVALHCHGGSKFYGKEKIAKGPEKSAEGIQNLWDYYYGGRPFANALAKEGCMVLVHDVFCWGSRRFTEKAIGERINSLTNHCMPYFRQRDSEADRHMNDTVAFYNYATRFHEQTVEKYCNLLGSTFAGVVNYEDRMAVEYLKTRIEVDPSRIGCIGLSGGGCRSGLLQAVCEDIKAAVIVGMMSTYKDLLDHSVADHTFMFFPAGWSKYGDWPNLVAARAPSPLLVQYNTEDSLFELKGMQKADSCLKELYAYAGSEQSYTGQFFPGHHKFDLAMQQAAFSWLKTHLQF